MDKDLIQDSLKREETFALPSGDGYRIYGTLNRAGNNRAANLVLIAHGLTGHINEHLHMSARRFFNEKGYDVARFAFYEGAENARKLRDCTLQIHAEDLRSVIDYLKPRYEKVFAVGHSYGGLSLLIANPDVEKASFWDSSFLPYETVWKESAEFVPELDCYKLNWECEYLIGRPMYEEARDLASGQAATWAENFQAPGQVVLAGANADKGRKIRTALYDALPAPKDFYEVEGAGHVFAEGDTVFDLLDATYRWFEA